MRILLRTLFVHGLVWTALQLLIASALFGEYDRRGVQTTLWVQWVDVWWTTLFLQGLGLALSWLFRRAPQLVDSGKRLVLTYLGMLALLLPPELVYQAARAVLQAGRALSVDSVWQRLTTEPKTLWLQCLLFETLVFVAVGAAAVWRHSQQRRTAMQAAQTENLQLRLDLEQQRMAALRGQLEPHFMFNALNAVSALVRLDDKKSALAAINRLSELLRYALAAGAREWSSLQEELEFVQSYLALQSLRYGTRLQVRIEGDDASVRACECPPLLLQPLVENALRHDLDCHDADSDIRIRFTLTSDALQVRICNPQRDGVAPNPGLGLGLANTRARLAHAYGERAHLDTHTEQARFCVDLRLPAGDAA